MIRLLAGDCRDVLPTLAASSVQCVVCSPPYYALRSYLDAAHPDKHREIGSEATPDEWIATMVAVMHEVRRVLRDDGTCWINCGDSFSGKQLLMMPARLALALQADGWWLRSDIIWAKPNPMPESCRDRPTSAHEHVFLLTKRSRYFYDADAVREEGTIPAGTLGAKGSEERFAMVGVNSRPPEYKVYSGTRNLRNVWTIATAPYSDAHFATFPPALAERCIKAGTSERGACSRCGKPWVRVTDKTFVPQPDVSLERGMRLDTQHDVANQWPGTPRGTTNTTTTGWSPGCQCNADVRLAERCIKAGTSEKGACPQCGAPWYRVSDKTYEPTNRVPSPNKGRLGAFGERAANMTRDGFVPNRDPIVSTIGWHPTCACDKCWPPRSCVVLDPFAGAGTTLLVADRLQRDAIGIELNVAYTEMAMQRCRNDAPLFSSWPPAEDPEEARMGDLFEEAPD